MAKHVHKITVEKLFPIYDKSCELKESFIGIGRWGLPHEYHTMSEIGLFIAKINNEIEIYGKFNSKVDKIQQLKDAIGIINSIIEDIVLEISLNKKSIFGLVKLESLRQKRDRYIDIIHIYNSLMNVLGHL